MDSNRMKKQKLYIMVSMDFQTEDEALEFSSMLISHRCGFDPVVKKIQRQFVVCRLYRKENSSDESLLLSDTERVSDGEPQSTWFYMEELR